MKIFRKVLTLLLCLMCAVSCCVFSASAAETEEASLSASGSLLYFRVPSDWHNYWRIYCHIWEYGSGTSLANWCSKKELCTDEGDGIWSYDPSTVGGLRAGVNYCVVFAADTGVQTYETAMTTECLGDTLYCDGTKFEGPCDSNKTAISARWNNNTQYGPVKTITSIGNVVGETYLDTPKELLKDFLNTALSTARTYSGKTDEQLIEDIRKGLGLSKNDVVAAINETNVRDLELSYYTPPTPIVPPITTNSYGDANGDSTVNIKDATIIQKYVANIISADYPGFFSKNADVNIDAKINVKDATAIQKYVAGIYSSLPVS